MNSIWIVQIFNFFFELINEFAIFQNFINDTLMSYFNKFVVTYLNDILIYSDNIKKHKKHVRKIFQKFRKIDIQTNIDKCKFHKIETKFLNVLIEKNKIRMNLIKIIAIVGWKTSTNLIQIQSFFEFVNFYRRFMKNFSKITKTLTRMTKKNFEFEWTFTYESIFQKLKNRVTEISILTHFNFESKTIIELNFSDYVSIKILFQKKKTTSFDSSFFFSKDCYRQNAIMKFMTKNCQRSFVVSKNKNQNCNQSANQLKFWSITNFWNISWSSKNWIDDKLNERNFSSISILWFFIRQKKCTRKRIFWRND